MPLTVGPGSISVAVVLGSQRPQAASSVTDITLLVSAAVLGLTAMALTIYFSYRFADRMVSMLGESGINVLIRLSAFILLCIGILIFWSGYSALVSSMPHP